MFGAGQAVGHHGGQQRINAAEHAQHSGIDHHQTKLIAGEGRQLKGGEGGGKLRNRAQAGPAEQGQSQQRAHRKSQQLRRAHLLHR